MDQDPLETDFDFEFLSYGFDDVEYDNQLYLSDYDLINIDHSSVLHSVETDLNPCERINKFSLIDSSVGRDWSTVSSNLLIGGGKIEKLEDFSSSNRYF